MPAWIVGGAMLGSGYLQADAAGDAADAAGAQVGESRRQFNILTQMGLGSDAFNLNQQMPYELTGTNAVNNLNILSGGGGVHVPTAEELELRNRLYQLEQSNILDTNGASPDSYHVKNALDEAGNVIPSEADQIRTRLAELQAVPTEQTTAQQLIEADPSYQFRLDQGNEALTNILSTQGRRGGNAIRSAVDYNQDFASNEYMNVFNRNLQLAGYGGQPAPTGTSNAVSSAGGNVLNSMGSVVNTAGGRQSAWANVLNQGANLGASYLGNQQILNALNPGGTG